MPKTLFYSNLMIFSCVFSIFIKAEPLAAATRIVNSISNDPSVNGTLPYWLLNANNNDIIDCSAIAGQQITLTSSLPAITKSFTIDLAGVTIDGANNYQAFQVAAGDVAISNVIIQNAISKGGAGGNGFSGGGGGVGGGGAIYIHNGTTLTLTALSLTDNIAKGGDGGSANFIGNGGGGGGGGFAGGNGGDNGGFLFDVTSGGGGGGHSNGGTGGRGGSSSAKNGSDGLYFGGGGGGAGINSAAPGGSGGNASPTGAFVGGTEFNGNAGGGAGDSENGGSATVSGVPGNGGNGIGADSLFGGGGGGGVGSDSGFPGGDGIGAAGGGGGANYSGGAGGILGGGGGGGLGHFGGAGGFGAGGGGAETGGPGGGGFGAGGGNGGSDPGSGNSGGGGGSGLGGAIFIQSGSSLAIVDAEQFSGNVAIAGVGGSSTSTGNPNYVSAGDGASMGQDIFLRQGGSLTFDLSNTLAISTPIEGDNTTPADTSGFLIKKGLGTLELNGDNTYVQKTTIEQGKLQLDGSLNGDLLITVGGEFSGNATVKGSIENNGIISPGHSLGTVNTTDLNLSLTSLYSVEIDPVNSDLIRASHLASLGGKIRVIQLSGSYPTYGRYTILTAANLSGSIDSLKVEGLPGFQFSLERDRFNLYLLYVLLLPPSNLTGEQVLTKDCNAVNILKWNAPTEGAPAVFYRVYRTDLDRLIGVVPANRELIFRDPVASKNIAYTYYIVSVDQQDNASSPAQITISPSDEPCSIHIKNGGGGSNGLVIPIVPRPVDLFNPVPLPGAPVAEIGPLQEAPAVDETSMPNVLEKRIETKASGCSVITGKEQTGNNILLLVVLLMGLIKKKRAFLGGFGL